MTPAEAAAFVVVSSAVFVFGASQLSPLCGWLSPVALAIVFWYSLAKRVTTYTQFFLGLAMAVAPVGGWLAAGGARRRRAVAGWRWPSGSGWAASTSSTPARTWTSTADTACARFPRASASPAAIRLSRLMHVGDDRRDGGARAPSRSCRPLYFAGVAFVAALLVYEQSLVAADDLSQVKRAFDLNGYVGIVYLAAHGPRALCRIAPRPANGPCRGRGGTLDKSPDRIAGMFDAIAPRYDLLNRLLSAGHRPPLARGAPIDSLR